MGNWLSARLPKDLLLVSSPAMRAYQTAQTLKCEVTVLESLKPGANLQEVLATLARLNVNQQNVLLVGHQPWLWQLVAHLTSFTAQDISIKKGAVWWLRTRERDGQLQTVVVTVQSPEML